MKQGVPTNLRTDWSDEHDLARDLSFVAGGVGRGSATCEFDIHGGNEPEGTLGILRIAGDDVG